MKVQGELFDEFQAKKSKPIECRSALHLFVFHRAGLQKEPLRNEIIREGKFVHSSAGPLLLFSSRPSRRFPINTESALSRAELVKVSN